MLASIVNNAINVIVGSSLLSALMASQAASAATASLTLKAEAGHFNAQTMGQPAHALSFKGSVHLTAFNGSTAWPTAAYLGVQQGANRDNSVQVLVVRNRASDPYMVVGHRLVVDGKEVAVASVENVEPSALVDVAITFQTGIATISINGRKPIVVKTPFTEVAPYASVSSGEGKFTVVQP